jgi:hypothetical protein
LSAAEKKEPIAVGDVISFRDAEKPGIGHGYGVIGFDDDGNPLVQCDGKILHVKPEQIEAVYPGKERMPDEAF